mmetsp:Transcript_31617/g.97278  ORF Transcript_31617/g.97278 Transcript_31617/m.97278 type:complete len:272 (-) Transcript_31617:1325-2140(-)
MGPGSRQGCTAAVDTTSSTRGPDEATCGVGCSDEGHAEHSRGCNDRDGSASGPVVLESQDLRVLLAGKISNRALRRPPVLPSGSCLPPLSLNALCSVPARLRLHHSSSLSARICSTLSASSRARASSSAGGNCPGHWRGCSHAPGPMAACSGCGGASRSRLTSDAVGASRLSERPSWQPCAGPGVSNGPSTGARSPPRRGVRSIRSVRSTHRGGLIDTLSRRCRGRLLEGTDSFIIEASGTALQASGSAPTLLESRCSCCAVHIAAPVASH